MPEVSIPRSNSEIRRWNRQIGDAFYDEFPIDIAVVPCVFHVPKALYTARPQIYAPHEIGLGPYHHFSPEPYKMERHKIVTARRLLKAEQIENFINLMRYGRRFIGATIRPYYFENLDLDECVLECVMVLDCLYLFDLLSTHESRGGAESSSNHGTISAAARKSAQDIFMLENQIPLVPFNEVLTILELNFPDGIHLYTVLKHLCEEHSPLKLSEGQQRSTAMRDHMLGFMYDLIINNRGIQDVPVTSTVKEDYYQTVAKIAATVARMGPKNVVKFTLWPLVKKIAALFRRHNERRNASVEEIDIPSVTTLSEIVGVQFTLKMGGIRDIWFDENGKTLYLPVIRLNSDSEVILKNLLAYEALVMTGSERELAKYIDLMCGIVDSPEDVRLLRSQGIIEGELADQDIADLFNGISKSTDSDYTISELEKTMDKVKEQYEKSPLVRAYKTTMKAIYASRGFFIFLTTVILLFLQIWQSFCQVYDCSSLRFKKSSILYTDM